MLKHAVKSCVCPVANSGGKVASLSKTVCVNGNFSESLMEPVVGGSPRLDPVDRSDSSEESWTFMQGDTPGKHPGDFPFVGSMDFSQTT